MKEILGATATGLVVGLLFARLKLPIPAPPTLAGVMGIVGLFLGYYIAVRFFGWGN
ncbi:XapX domain-containing protein [Desulfolucanica intricata]|uniref:XapX domain-containing protein n=1 Tax=Desulfolucanica intricata TaxID=1285191 RepID=UPI00082A56BB|nr:XapX domain-containing protein [Desulfolucanica intricata]